MIRYASIGTSKITQGFCEACELDGRFVHEAVYSRSYERGNEFAKKTSAKRVVTDLEQLAADDSIDAVYIASPNIFHYPQSKLMLEHKKNVICEKPITTAADEYKKLKELADKNNVIYMEAIVSKHSASNKPTHDALARLGKISVARFDYCQLSSRYDEYKSGGLPNIFNMELHAGTLNDLGIYCVYAMIDLLGRPKDLIYASADYLDCKADKSGCSVFDYGDFKAILTYSKTGQSAIGSEIIADNGTLKIGSVSQYYDVDYVTKENTEHIFGRMSKAELMRGEASAFADYISGKLDGYEETSQLTQSVSEFMDKIKEKAGIVYPARKA